MSIESSSSDQTLIYKELPDKGLSDFLELRSTPEGRKILEGRLLRSFEVFAQVLSTEVPVYLRPEFRISDADLGRKVSGGITDLSIPMASQSPHF